MRKSGLALLTLAALIAGHRALTRTRPLETASAASVVTPTRKAERTKTPLTAGQREVHDPAPFPRRADLERYNQLAAKIFSSDGEAEERRQLLHDPDLLRAAGLRLILRQSPTKSLNEEQSRALALLLEAARAGEPAAIAALTAVVKDAGVEDTSVKLEVREQLAGLKAEALYVWSADDPSVGDRVQAWLPGPVSRQLWRNVMARQQANVATSLGPENDEKVAR